MGKYHIIGTKYFSNIDEYVYSFNSKLALKKVLVANDIIHSGILKLTSKKELEYDKLNIQTDIIVDFIVKTKNKTMKYRIY